MRRACVECSWNITPYLLVCVDVRDMSVIVNDTCAVHAWFMRDKSVISVLETPKIKQVHFSTHKHAQTKYVRDL